MTEIAVFTGASSTLTAKTWDSLSIMVPKNWTGKNEK